MPEMFCKKGTLKHFTKFKVKQMSQSLAHVFSCKVCEISKNTSSSYRTPLVAASVEVSSTPTKLS